LGTTRGATMYRKWSLAVAGAILILAGSVLAYLTQTSGGIKIRDVRFPGAKGNIMSALLYVPPNATAQTPAPGILAVHGYINSRETQDGFAIEFARRGYVVLALDQTGHGYSDPPAFANGFGGPDGLAYLRSLDIVDKNNIGLEGHSMGGWTVLAAATAMPNDYKSMVLEGSSTGKPFAAEGNATWPRNAALVFAQYEEFPDLMWGVERARDVTQSPKLWALFGTQGPVEPGKIYGDVAQGTARVLYTPPITHPDEHISPLAIGYSLDWFAKTLQGGTPRPSDDQIWFRKEIGTLIALMGFVVLLLGVRRPARSAGILTPEVAGSRRRQHAHRRCGQGRPMEGGLRAFRLHSRADLLSGICSGRHAGDAITLSAPGRHQPDHGLGPHQRADRARAYAVRAQTRPPHRDRRAVDPDCVDHGNRWLCRALAR
jgi:pimeloyl-ACP methyl ester carboxylesterase